MCPTERPWGIARPFAVKVAARREQRIRKALAARAKVTIARDGRGKIIASR